MARIRSAIRESDEPRVVPLRRQYLEIKARFPDTILLFRLGDFYETFEEDAEIAAEVLDIVLTSREMGKGHRVPLAGIPYHAAEGYIARLIAAGHKVAICEQIGEVTRGGTGRARRDPGRHARARSTSRPCSTPAATTTSPASSSRATGSASPRPTSRPANSSPTEIGGQTIADALMAAGRELLRLQPAEIVRPGRCRRTIICRFPKRLAARSGDPLRADRRLAVAAGPRRETLLQRHFGVAVAGRIRPRRASRLATRAAGGLLALPRRHAAARARRRSPRLRTYSHRRFMTLDCQTRRNLELAESARGEKTAQPDRRARSDPHADGRPPAAAAGSSQPLLELDELKLRQRDVRSISPGRAAARRPAARDSARSATSSAWSTARSPGPSSPRELRALRQSLAADRLDLARAGRHARIGAGDPGLSADVESLLDARPLSTSHRPSSAAARPSAPASRPSWTSTSARAREAREWIAGLERTERERTGIRSLKVGYNKVFGYYLEITNCRHWPTAERPSAVTVLAAGLHRKQTLANATRYFTPQLKEYEALVLTAEDTLSQLEARHLSAGRRPGRGQRRPVAGRGRGARLPRRRRRPGRGRRPAQLCRPELDDDDVIEIEGGRHPTSKRCSRAASSCRTTPAHRPTTAGS